MVKGTPKGEETEGKAAEKPVSKIAVMNLSRFQPLSFHVPGGSVRLGPLEARELEPNCLYSPELAHLIATGAVQTTERRSDVGGEAAAHEGENPPAGTDMPAGGQAERPGPRPEK